MTTAGRGLKLNAYDGGSAVSLLPPSTAPSTLLILRDSSRIPVRPANQNLNNQSIGPTRSTHMTAIEICCTCLTVYGSCGLEPNRSIQVLVIPYRKMTEHSTISADGPLLPPGGLFQAHPRSAYAPRYRANVNTPYLSGKHQNSSMSQTSSMYSPKEDAPLDKVSSTTVDVSRSTHTLKAYKCIVHRHTWRTHSVGRESREKGHICDDYLRSPDPSQQG